MKLLVLAPQPFFQQRGTPLATLRALRILSEAGHEIDLLSYHEGEPIEIDGCRHHRIPAFRALDGVPPGFSFRKLICDALMMASAIRLCRNTRYDAVHANEEAVFIAMALRSLFGTPYVYDMDSSLPEQLADRFSFLRPIRALLRFLERRAIRSSAGVVAVCPALAEIVRSEREHPPVVCVEDASLLPTGPGPVDPETPLRWPGAGSRRAVMYVGNLQAYQGIDLLLDSFERLVRRRRDVDLVIVGGSEVDIERYRARARELGIDGYTHFLGPRPVSELGSLLAEADLVVSPRVSGRNTPMKVFSYLDSGTPVLATALPTHTQVLDPEIAVLVSPVPGAMAAGMDRLLSDPAMGARLAEAARRRVEHRFNEAALDQKFAGFYREIFPREPPAPARDADPRTRAPARPSTRRAGANAPARPGRRAPTGPAPPASPR